MKFIKSTTWEEVFAGWREREANNPGWIDCATKIKGWPDWESWRRYSASQIGADRRNWQIFEFADPVNEIPRMLVGPYSGWQSRLPGVNANSFEDLVNIPKQFEEFNKHDGVKKIMSALPFKTEFIGIVRKDLGKIVCLEGHHRAVAISLARKLGNIIDFRSVNITIALAELPENEIDLLDKMLKRGTSKNSP